MSSRRIVCFLPSASSRSIEVFVSLGQQAAQDAAVGGRDRVLEEVPLDRSARVEDVDNQLALGMRGHAGEVRADLAPLARVRVALGAFRLEESPCRARRRRPSGRSAPAPG